MVEALFTEGTEVLSVSGLWQYDYDQKLVIKGLDLPLVCQIDFSLVETGVGSRPVDALTVDQVTVCNIPNQYLWIDSEDNYKIFAFIYVIDENGGETRKKIKLRVNARPKNIDMDTPVERPYFEEVVATVRQLAEQTALNKEGTDTNFNETTKLKELVNEYLDKVIKFEETIEKQEKLIASQVVTTTENANTATEAKKTALIYAERAESAEKSASEYADQVSTDAEQVATDRLDVLNMKNATIAAKAEIDNAFYAIKTMQIEIVAEHRNALSEIENSKNNALKSILLEETTSVESIENAENDALTNIGSKKTEAENAVDQKKTEAVNAVEAKKTEALNSLEPYAGIRQELTDTEEEVGSLQEKLNEQIAINARQQKEIEDKDRRITNLEYASKGILYREDVSESEDYTKDIPADVMPYGLLDKVGAKSVVFNQMYDVTLISYPLVTDSIFTYRNYDDYVEVELKDDNRSFVYVYDRNTQNKNKSIAGHRYLFIYTVETNGEPFDRAYGKIIVNESSQLVTVSPSTKSKLFAISTCINNYDTQRICVAVGRSSSNWVSGTKFKFFKDVMTIDLTQMFGAEVADALTEEDCRKIFSSDYYPYCEPTIVSAEPQKVVSRGRNLFDGETTGINQRIATSAGTTYPEQGFSVSEFIPVEGIETYSLSVDVNSYYAFYDSDKRYILGGSWSKNTSRTAPAGAKYVRFDFHTAYINSVQLEKGSLVTPYAPYFKEEKTLASIISKYFPTGMKSAGKAYDYFDIENGVAVQNVDGLDLDIIPLLSHQTNGAIDFWYGGNQYFERLDTYEYKNGIHCVSTYEFSYVKKITGTNTRFYVNNNEQRPNGIFYFALATPITTTLDPEDIECLKIIQLEAGGTLTFENGLEGLHIPLPNKETFLVKTGGAS